MGRVTVLGVALTVLLLAGAAQVHADELDDIVRSGVIKVATDLAIPPAGMMNGEMQPIGSDVETAQLLAKDWGLRLEFVPTTGPTRIPNVLSGKADIAISTLSVTPERAKVVAFSRPYTVLRSVVGGPSSKAVSDLAGLRGMTVAVTRGTTQDTKMSALSSANGFSVRRYDDDATLVTAGATGQADLIATSVALVDAVAQKNPSSGFGPKFVLDNFDIAVGLRKGEPRLLEKLNQWILDNLKNDKLNRIYSEYYKVELPASMRPPEVH